MDNKLLLITQDKDLAYDIMQLNCSRSVRGKNVKVGRISKSGKIKLYEEEFADILYNELFESDCYFSDEDIKDLGELKKGNVGSMSVTVNVNIDNGVYIKEDKEKVTPKTSKYNETLTQIGDFLNDFWLHH